MESILHDIDYHTAAAMLLWQVDLGATEAMGDAPLNRYDLADAAPPLPRPAQAAAPAPLASADPVAVARQMAAAAASLEGLHAAMQGYDLCELKRGAKSTVFSDGNPSARVMLIGEAPGRDEDMEGRPFVGKAGQLLDRMFAAIGLARSSPDPAAALYITNVMPWRPPQNRDPSPAEIAMMQPFLERHVQLADPDLIVVMGNTPCQAVLGRKGITRLRGEWTTGYGRPLLPMVHPAYLLRNPAFKREAWADLLALKARLRGLA